MHGYGQYSHENSGHKKLGSPDDKRGAITFNDLIILACCDIGLKLVEFFDLTIFEWCLYLEKHRRCNELEIFKNELAWTHTREIIASIYNVNRDTTKHPEPFKGSDIKKLSFDKEFEEPVKDLKEAEKENAEYFRKVKSKMGSKFKKDGK